MHLPFLDADALRSALDYPSAVAALEAGYAGPFNVPARLQMDAGEGRLWLMPAASDDALGMKLVTQFDSNAARGIERIQGLYIYLDAETGQPLALLDGRAITGIRTAAVSALATRWMANAGPATLAVFGTGVQAGAHVVAMRALFDVRDVMVCGASLEKSRAFEGRPRGAARGVLGSQPDLRLHHLAHARPRRQPAAARDAYQRRRQLAAR
jgi:ornithine cyclodeaminase